MGLDVHRRNPGGFYYGTRTGRRGYVRQETPGSCDYWFIYMVNYNENISRHVELEIKRPGAWPRDEQIAWMLRMNMQGCFAFWVWSVDQLGQGIDALGRGENIALRANGQYSFEPIDTARTINLSSIRHLIETAGKPATLRALGGWA
jgi:hypothetical protein